MSREEATLERTAPIDLEKGDVLYIDTWDGAIVRVERDGTVIYES